MKLSRLQGVFIALFVFLVSFCSADYLIQSAADEMVSVLSINDESPGCAIVCVAPAIQQSKLQDMVTYEFIKKDFLQTNIPWYKESLYCNVITQNVIELENYYKTQIHYKQVFKPELYKPQKLYPLKC